MKTRKQTITLILITSFFISGTICGVCKNWYKEEVNNIIIKKSEDILR